MSPGGTVDQDIDVLSCGGHHGLDLDGIRQVGCHRSVIDFSRDPARGVAVEVGNADVHLLGRQGTNDHRTESAATAGDNCSAGRKLHGRRR